MKKKQDGMRLRSGKEIPGTPGDDPSEQSRRNDLSEISQALKKDADMAFTEAIPGRILDNIRKQLGEKKKNAPKRKNKRRMAARPWVIRLALLAVCVVLFLGLAVTAKKKETPGKPPRPDRTGAGPSYAEFIARPAPKSQQYRTPAAFSSSVSPLELRLRGDFFCVFDGVDEFRLSPPGYIPSRTDQLWTTRSFEASALKEHLSSLSGELRIGDRKITRSGNVLIYSASLSPRQAAVLVKQLAAWGLTPVSRSGPRPDRYLYCGSGGGQVRLTLTILMKDRDGAGRFSREERELFLGQIDPSGGGR